MEYPDYLSCLRTLDPALAAEIAEFHTLETVLPWMERRGITLGSADLISQDECSYDFVIPLSDGRFLSFGISCCGALFSVTLWPTRPTADELLARRLEDGWRPTPSHLQEGKIVVGNAACVNPALWKEVRRFEVTDNGESKLRGAYAPRSPKS